MRALLPVMMLLSCLVVLPAETATGAPPSLTTMTIEELMELTVYAASKFEQRISEAPASVTIVTAEEIAKHGYRTLADILRSVRGLYVTYDRNYWYIGVRGFNRPGDSNSRILVMVDSHRITENLYDGSNPGTDFILDVDLIDRVEVIRGPGSVLYGSNALFATVNVVTRTGKSLAGAAVSGEGGSLQTYKARLSYGRAWPGGPAVLLSATRYDSSGQKDLYYREFDAPTTNDGIAGNADGDDNFSLFSSCRYGDFSLSGAFVSRDKRIPTASYGTLFNDSRTRTTDALGYANLEYKHVYPGKLEVKADISYNRYQYRGWYVYDTTEPEGPVSTTINRDDTLGEWFGVNFQLSRPILGKHRLILGAEYRDNFRQRIRNYDEEPPLVYTDIEQDTQVWGLFAEVEAVLHRTLLLNLGLRHDHYGTFGGTTNPRLALIYHPHERSTVKLIYGQAFRSPNAWESFVSDPASKGNPDLNPETINNYELVYEQGLAGGARLTIDGYVSRVKGLISQEPDPADGLLVNRNLESVSSRGVELELSGTMHESAKWRFSYAWQRSENGDTGQELDNSPRHLGKASLEVPLVPELMFASVDLQYHGSAKTLSGARTEAFWLANATLYGRTFGKRLDVSVGIYNVFDASYAYPGATQHVQDTIEQDGRTLRLKLVAHF